MIDFYDLAEKRSVGEIRELYPISQIFRQYESDGAG